MCYTSKAIGPKAHNKTQYTLTLLMYLTSLKESFSSVSFRWVSRVCNQAAHKAARMCLLSLNSFSLNNCSFPVD